MLGKLFALMLVALLSLHGGGGASAADLSLLSELGCVTDCVADNSAGDDGEVIALACVDLASRYQLAASSASSRPTLYPKPFILAHAIRAPPVV